MPTTILKWIEYGVYKEDVRVLLKIIFCLLQDNTRKNCPWPKMAGPRAICLSTLEVVHGVLTGIQSAPL